MINQVEVFENAARIATADALLFDEIAPPQVRPFVRWFGAVCLSLLPGKRNLR